MPPFNGKCEVPEKKMGRDVIVISEKRSGNDEQNNTAHQGETPKMEMRTENRKVEKVAQDEDDAKVTINPKAYNNFHLIWSKIKGTFGLSPK